MLSTAEETLREGNEKVVELQAEIDRLESTLPQKPEPIAPKFDPAKHPLLKKASEKQEPAKPAALNTGDLCEAQWSDRQWYKAKIQTIMGSASDPKYLVRFLDYDDSTLTVGRDSVRPLLNERKRKEAPTAAPTVGPVVNSPHVISAPATKTAATKSNGDADTSAPTNRRKIGGNKALERKMNSWQSFQRKGPGKMVGKKESQFRTGAGPNARVGFTGSGGGMTQVPKRVRYNAKDQMGGDEDERTYD
ncbi:hypothetical protein M011DRAFT_408211 [Sporormia fimetaria CBS 119925]|uniref:Tudor domain-containing protein n=1 Tax=Sporormia fimetaria CBS 119925 TaxID=1340428 RepID=A0A6A6V5X5_9PLEO|nr:hypothetical protein M011DRAFT_408211 [Sporormia fimetaria CBS 119925]